MLKQILNTFRESHAITMGVSRYSVLGDHTIEDIVSMRPRTEAELERIPGLSAERRAAIGQAILYAVNNTIDQPKSIITPTAVVTIRHSGYKPRGKPPPKLGRHHEINPFGIDKDRVYILELAGGKVYVGKSRNVPRRIQQHMDGIGSVFTKTFKPTGKELPRLSKVYGGGDSMEREETLRYMFLRGIDNVRGWKYTRVSMTPEEFNDAEGNIRELFGLCRRCGNGRHFISCCPYTYDRHGKPLRPLGYP